MISYDAFRLADRPSLRHAIARLAIVAIVLYGVNTSTAGEEPFAPRHVAKLKGVGSVVVSPDGKQVAQHRAGGGHDCDVGPAELPADQNRQRALAAIQ